MRNSKTWHISSKAVWQVASAVVFVMLVLALAGVGAGGSAASAASSSNSKSKSTDSGGANTVTATVKYCKSKAPKNLQSECTTDNMNTLRQAVSAQCQGKSNKNACIENLAENAVDQVVSKKPKNKHDFESALSAVAASATSGTYDPSSEPTPTGQGKNCDSSSDSCDLISLYVNPFIQVLSIIVGLVVAASLVGAGVQYAVSSGDPQKTSAAKSRISNTLLAFVLYAFLYAFLNFLIPGGIF